ncbi:MAG: GNAT family acetyltransferase [Pseudomonadota bacterium]
MTDPLEIRPFQAKDRTGVIALWDLVFPGETGRRDSGATIDLKQTVQSDLFFVAVSGDRLIGTVLAGFDGVRGWVHRLAVHEDHRRQGIAAQLMARAEAGLKALGCPKLNLQVRGSNEHVVQFYKALGYDVEDRISLGKPLP